MSSDAKSTMRIWFMCGIISLIAIGWAIRHQPAPETPPEALPAAERAHPRGPGFIDDYLFYLRTGDLPARYPAYTLEVIK